MNYLPTIKMLYVINGVFAILLYLPQIVSVWKEDNKSMSLVTFGGWSIGALITAFYAWFSVRDVVFTVISLAHMVGSGSIFLIVAGKRLKISKSIELYRPKLTQEIVTGTAQSAQYCGSR